MLLCWNMYLHQGLLEKEVVMSVQLNERWKQEQFDNWPAMKSASSEERKKAD